MSSQLIPRGYSDYIPTEAQAQAQLIQHCAEMYGANGYSPIATPTVELVSSLEVGMATHLLQRAVKFFDSFGQLVSLRPDNTTPIARIVSSRMQSDPLPLKLYYHAPIFRHATCNSTPDIETFQSGIEYIGDADVAADAHVIATCVHALRQCGVTDFHIDIGHTDFTNGLSQDDQTALLNGDYLSLGKIPPRGPIDDMQSIDTTHDLHQLHRHLSTHQLTDRVTYNQGLVKDIHYYTGTLFEIYTNDTKQVIASGGRYDRLLSKFGYDQPAVGMALNLTRIQDYVT